ncbi:MAG: response regulator transcription factor [Caldilineae bacterium]|nr:response regulator transcription factor [Anaerolineae bacterium]MCB0202552.1 response regulator transcription factor [Anaerolineae bacterium]MCB9152779.1 response regulator transcription factor [Caldilineae bacterium]
MTSPDPRIRILVADDHPIVRDGLVAVLSTQADFQVVGEAGNGFEVVSQVAALVPDIVLLDLEMPEMDGVQALEQLRSLGRPVRAIAFTAFDSDERILSAVRAGAKGYLLKGAPREELFNAVRVVHAGGSLLQPIVASRLIERMTEPVAEPLPEPLTPRELEVLGLMAVGLQNKEIGDRLAITERTVKFHVSSILGKLEAGNRTEAVSIAVQQGLIER